MDVRGHQVQEAVLVPLGPLVLQVQEVVRGLVVVLDHLDLLARLANLVLKALLVVRGLVDGLVPLDRLVLKVPLVVRGLVDGLVPLAPLVNLVVLGLTVVLVHLGRLAPQDPWDRLACLVARISSPSCLATIQRQLRLGPTYYSPKTVPRLD